tara:strand:+ start:16079 stop:17134 length:1056 start_codon:yes stop_codon:yes gene_type:complete
MYKIDVKSYRSTYTVEFMEDVSGLTPVFSDNNFILIDSRVKALYPLITKYLRQDRIFVVEATEENKTLEYCQQIISELITRGIKRNYKLVAIGGGITQDITGFISSILYRGIEWDFIPTTLLAQADSCIGSKTSINFSNVKNLLGTFHPPSKIYCCSEFLSTLSKEEIKSGIGEILHYYCVDGNEKAFAMMRDYDEILEDTSLIAEHVYESLRIKKRMIEHDEFDQHERRVFNYGHTFGHAIEGLSGYSVPHGQAVTIGMDMANFISLSLGYIDNKEYATFRDLLQKNMPSYSLRKEQLNRYMSLLGKDKKNVDKSIVCILPHSYGDIRVEKIEDKGQLGKIIESYIERTM